MRLFSALHCQGACVGNAKQILLRAFGAQFVAQGAKINIQLISVEMVQILHIKNGSRFC